MEEKNKNRTLTSITENNKNYSEDFDKGDLASKPTLVQPPKYQDVFGHTLVELAKQNSKIVGITPAMPTGSSLKYMMEEIPERAFDVGIAEQHAVTMAAGMVIQGLIPFCNIYSTFLQRAYDQIIHDVALQRLPVIFCLDRAGLVGEDGATHHGVFDLSYLRCIPNLTIFAPRNEVELRNIMYTAQLGLEQPMAIRYPRGRGVTLEWKQSFEKIIIGKGVQLKKGDNLAVLSMGTMAKNVSEAIENLDVSFDISKNQLTLRKVETKINNIKLESSLIKVEEKKNQFFIEGEVISDQKNFDINKLKPILDLY